MSKPLTVEFLEKLAKKSADKAMTEIALSPSPQQEFRRIMANIKAESVTGKSNELAYITPAMETIQGFIATKIVTPVDQLIDASNYSSEHMDKLNCFLVYGAAIDKNGIVSGCVIDEHKDGYYEVGITGDVIRTSNLGQAEFLLFENWYKHGAC
jgi:hypothetical protein